MITNERQYKITKSEVDRFRTALQEFNEIELIKQGIDPVIVAAQRSSLEQQLHDLRVQISEYETLRSGNVTRLFPSSIREIGQSLIEARVARNLSQRELAERLGMKEQQIQRYEQERYLTANLNRIAEVADALQFDLVAFFESRTDMVLEEIAPNLKRGFDVGKLPIKEMKKRGWLSTIKLPQQLTGPLSDAQLAAAFVSQAVSTYALHRQNIRLGCKQDEYALLAWKARILQRARDLEVRTPAGPLEAAQSLVPSLVRLSPRKTGPIEAIELLRRHGVIVVIEPHLPATHLDGAAMMSDDKPIIALTLRHDRFDNFWFTLLHELGHIFLHRNQGLKDGFFDEEGAPSADELEREADNFAESALIPTEVWAKSFVRFTRDKNQVLEFAKNHGISSAVVAGRLRRERKDYSLFSELVGQGQLLKMMSSAGFLEK
ncbi:helix-turn-helix domain-containing protein [Bradyrhizobium sp. HKCCYLRH2060]|uniref:helix-turn-helix domain-containing protein n=1 Tax=Bradyrhizobium sp. HKCCYLRH2060 TaxID=3420743 RepID=UPI003EB9625F